MMQNSVCGAVKKSNKEGMVMFCPHCGKENTGGNNFCQECGKAITNVIEVRSLFKYIWYILP
jgi:predicted amidophosphoribosyltransferase